MAYCSNYFESGWLEAEFSVDKFGRITPDAGVLDGQYIAITGSVLNNGVYQVRGGCIVDGAQEETFRGRIWYLCPPRAFVQLCAKIEEYREKNADGNAMLTESFGEYSYTKATNGRGSAATWQDVFWNQLKPYMKMFTEVQL